MPKAFRDLKSGDDWFAVVPSLQCCSHKSCSGRTYRPSLELAWSPRLLLWVLSSVSYSIVLLHLIQDQHPEKGNATI